MASNQSQDIEQQPSTPNKEVIEHHSRPSTTNDRHGEEHTLPTLHSGAAGPRPAPRRRRITFAGFRRLLKRRRRAFIYILVTVACMALSFALSFRLADFLLPQTTDLRIPQTGDIVPEINLLANFIGVDPSVGTMTIDWYVVATNCDNPPRVARIYYDPNTLIRDIDIADESDIPSTDESNEPVFIYNTLAWCEPGPTNSVATFRTVLKLLDDSGSFNSPSSLQRYPFDQYSSQIAMFARDNETNADIPMQIAQTWGVPVNFDINLDVSDATEAILYGILLVTRSRAVQALTVIILTANWLVTIVFLCFTTASVIWREQVVKELFVIPVASLFAFTAVRSNLPGAPAGFGAYIDIVGILPNLAIITLCSGVILGKVLWERIYEQVIMEKDPEAGADED